MTVAKLPPHEDPDEFARRDPAGWQRAIEQSAPLIEYLIDAQTADLALDTPQGKMEASRRLLPILAEVRNRTLAGEYADRLAAHLHLDVHDVQRDLAETRRRIDRETRAQTTQPGRSRHSRIRRIWRSIRTKVPRGGERANWPVLQL